MGKLGRNIIIVVAAIIVIIVALSVYAVMNKGTGVIENGINTVLTPFKKAASTLSGSISDFVESVTNYSTIKEQKEELENKLNGLERQIAELESYKAENEHLKDVLDIKEHNPSYVPVAASVISKGADNWSELITIDKGSIDGIKYMDTVVTKDGLFGYIYEVGINYSNVATIINSETSVGARVIRSRENGVMEGDFELAKNGYCKLSYIDKDALLSLGDLVETSGLGEVFPQGLLIGRIKDIQLEPHGITKYAVIEPVVKFSEVKQVIVITAFGYE